MRVEEIALRQEIRQMLSEADINRNTIRDMVRPVITEEVKKQVENAINQTNVNALVLSKMNTYEFREALRKAIEQVIKDEINISIDVRAEIPKHD